MFTRSSKHLASVNETYFQHQHFAFKFGLTCIKAGMMALIHGVVPAYFESRASETVQRLAGMQRQDS